LRANKRRIASREERVRRKKRDVYIGAYTKRTLLEPMRRRAYAKGYAVGFADDRVLLKKMGQNGPNFADGR
jgi:hypothetical protein